MTECIENQQMQKAYLCIHIFAYLCLQKCIPIEFKVLLKMTVEKVFDRV